MSKTTQYSMNLFFILLISICVVSAFSSCTKQAPDEPFELPKYRIKGPEPYGSPGTGVGAKFWINLAPETNVELIENLVKYQVKSRKDYKLMLGGSSYLPSEMTFFIYNQPSEITNKEKIPGEDIADIIYEWHRTSDSIKRTK